MGWLYQAFLLFHCSGSFDGGRLWSLESVINRSCAFPAVQMHYLLLFRLLLIFTELTNEKPTSFCDCHRCVFPCPDDLLAKTAKLQDVIPVRHDSSLSLSLSPSLSLSLWRTRKLLEPGKSLSSRQGHTNLKAFSIF